MTFDEARAIAMTLPGVEESPSYGTPGLKVRGKLLARLWPDGQVLVITRVTFDEREFLMEAAPETFFITDHYLHYPSVLARLATLDAATLLRLLTQTWREFASRAQLRAFETRGGTQEGEAED
jgi:hypothetical protein